MIVLATDFGLAGPYTGQVKAMLARAAPGVPVIDLFADLPPFDPRPAAYLLPAYTTQLEPGDVVLAVVDPGVGSSRRGLALDLDGRWFVGPDNGLFELLLRRAGRWVAFDLGPPPDGAAATFHGRDVFAPAAARLARGDRPASAPVLPLRRSEWPDDLSAIVYLDGYGNAMTGLRAAQVRSDVMVDVAGRRLACARTFSDVPPGTAFWYENANGLVEIAVSGGAADTVLGLRVGDPVRLHAAA